MTILLHMQKATQCKKQLQITKIYKKGFVHATVTKVGSQNMQGTQQ